MSSFLPSLKKRGHLDPIHMGLCTVGSRKVGSGSDFSSQGWDIFSPNLTIYGFDADSDACNALNQDLANLQINWQETHIPLAMSDRTDQSTIYVTQHPMCSSLYPPNETYLSRFQGLLELTKLDYSVQIETTTLDEFYAQNDRPGCDFLKIDVQGAELLVLKGAEFLLNQTVLAIQVEVEFSSLYLNQPLFADVDVYLRSQGFVLFDFPNLSRLPRARSPIKSSNRPGQLLWGDAYYFRDPLQADTNAHFKSPEKILKLACIADILNYPDYVIELLEHLTLNYGENPVYNCADAMVESLSEFPPLREQGLKNLEVIQNISPYLKEPVT